MGKVPALVDAGVVITESGATAAYLADRHPEKQLAPPIGDPLRGAYYRWLFFSPGCIEPSFVELTSSMEVQSGQAGWGSAARALDVVEEAVSAGDYLVGGRFTMADLMVASGLRFGMMFEIFPKRPAFEAYVGRCSERPAFRRMEKINQAALGAG